MIRYGVYIFLKPSGFPYATFLVNISGSLLIGIVIALCLKDENFSNNWKLFLAAGICGGFTTFSAFSLENMDLILQGKYLLSIIYIAGSVILGILATWMGYKLIG